MTSWGRVWTALLATVVAAGVTGCADARDDAGAPQPADVGPDRPGAGGGELVVEALPLDAPVLLDPVPEGLLLDHLSYRPPEDDLQYNGSSGGYEPARATLYGDPDLADTLDGPVLLVGTSSGSATIAGPRRDDPGEQVELGSGRTGRVVHDTDRTWVVIEGNDYTEFVVGRGIDEDELVAAARGADFTSATTALARDAVPDGLEPLIAGSSQDRPGSGSGVRISLRGHGGWITVEAVQADPRLAALWGFWLEDGTGTSVRGHPGSSGDLQGANVGDADARGRVWAENGMVLSAVAAGMGDQPVDRDELLDEVVEGLRVGTWAEFEALDGELRTRPPLREEVPVCGPDGGGFVSGVDGTVRWSIELAPNTLAGTYEWVTCSFDHTSGGGSGGTIAPPPPVGELVTSVGSSGIVGGVAPPGTARVTVTTADGRVVEAQLSDVGPRPGERVWGTLVPQDPPAAGGPPLTATAYDATGATLDSTPV